MTRKKILILGAGLAGLSAAWHLQQKGIDCQVFEKEPEPGGLCRSRKVNGFTFDCDGHLLHFKRRHTFDLVRDLLGDNLVEHKRDARVYSSSRYSRYPFQANLYGLPKRVVKDCVAGFAEAAGKSCKPENNLSFLDWIRNNFGSGIAEHFMIPYNSKFWTVPPEDLTCEWLDGFIPVPSLAEVIKGSTRPNRRQYGYNARFWYPKRGGIGELARAFSKKVKNIHTDAEVKSIDIAKKTVITAGSKEKFDILILTAPLPELPNLAKNLPGNIRECCRSLKWNSVLNINLGTEHRSNEKYHWAYFSEKHFEFFRLGFYHNFSSVSSRQSSGALYAEVSYRGGKAINKPAIVKNVKSGLKKIGVINGSNRILAKDINDIKYGYPIYDRNYASAISGIGGYLLDHNILPCGRYGAWRYMSMEDAILSGKESAEKVRKLL